MNIFNELPSKDIELISAYRKTYGYYGSDNPNGTDPCGLDHFLRIWASNKEYLYHLFGDQFVLRRPFEYQKPLYEIEKAIHREMRGEGDMYEFDNALYHLTPLGMSRCLGRAWSSEAKMYDRLCNPGVLAHNSYTGSPFDFPMPDGKVLHVDRGCKPVKMLAKVAKAYDLPGFEKFRLAHSRCLNQKTYHGTMCLSIHPMDYMTMSDNNYNWESCMNWRNGGCYRRGTIECMNSPLVVVAYLDGDEPFEPISGYSWSNKKWRSLFVVDDYIMTSVKGYPYQETAFNTFVLDWLRELRSADRTYGDPFTYEYECGRLYTTGDNRTCIANVNISCSGAMYCDMGSVEHDAVIATEGIPECCHVDYSGPSVCIHCGAVEANYCGDESYLCCEDCAEKEYRCCCCDDHYSEEDGEWWNDSWYCYDCLNDNHPVSEITGDRMVDPEMVSIVPDGVEMTKHATYYRDLSDRTRQYLRRRGFDEDIDSIKEYAEDLGHFFNAFVPGAKLRKVETERSGIYYYVRVSDFKPEFLINYCGFDDANDIARFNYSDFF